jgi:hypothetical protein
MKWITRERVKVDRVACPWLIKKFIDPEAEFFFVPAKKVMEEAEQKGTIPLARLRGFAGHDNRNPCKIKPSSQKVFTTGSD